MELAFEAVNKYGKFQKNLVLIVLMLPISVLVISAGFPFLTANPIILCKEKEEYSKSYEKCFFKDICPFNDKFEILKNYELSVHNWAYEFDLYCDKSFYLPLIGTCFFIGAIIGCVLLAPIPDRYGRLPLFKGLLILNIFIQFNYLFAQNIQHIIILSILAGITSYTGNITSLLITELIDRKISGIIMSIRSASFGIVGILLALYFNYVNNLKILFIFTFGISILVFYLVNKYFVESPRWLNSKNLFLETIEAFKKISIINNSKENLDKFLDLNKDMIDHSAGTIKEIKKNYNIIDVFYLKSQKKKLIILIYMWFSITLCFYGLFTNLDRPGGNIFMDSIVTYTAEIVAELISGWCAGVFGRIIMIRVFSFMGGSGFIIYFLLDSKALCAIFIFLASFGFSGSLNILYIYTPEAFPTSIRAITFGFLYLVSRSAAVVIPIMSKLSPKTPILLGVLAIIGGIIITKLEETLGKEMMDDIPEAKRTFSVLSKSNLSAKYLDKFSTSGKLKQTIVEESYFRLSIERV